MTHNAIRVSDLRCPLCGCSVKWHCGTGDYPTGRAHCENGREVSRRVEWPGEICGWAGTPLVRVNGEVFVDGPIHTETIREKDARIAAERASRVCDRLLGEVRS